MMRKLFYAITTAALLAVSCIDGIEDSANKTDSASAIPADFTWKTTCEVHITVAAPTVNGTTPDYAVIRIYSSPIIDSQNQVAMGVAKAGKPFSTAFTIPASAENLYVETTLPNGTKSVEAVKAEASIQVAGASVKTAAAPRMRLAAATRVASSMPAYPTLTSKTEADFDPAAVIRTTPATKYDLGADYVKWDQDKIATDAYYIPAGAVIEGNIDLNGGHAPYKNPALYVAGTLKVDGNLGIGTAQLIVLAGGKVEIDGNLAASPNSADYPIIYLFEGAQLTADEVNISGHIIVNNGKFVVDGKLDLNNSITFYNTASAELIADEMPLSNSVTVHNDGKISAEDIKMNSTAEFYNYENATLTVEDEFELNNKSHLYQKGRMTAEYMNSQSEAWIECYTKIDELVVKAQGIFYIASGAALEAETAELNQSDFYLGNGAYFITETLNDENKGGKNNFIADNSNTTRAIVLIKEKAGMKHKASFSGYMEVVYDNADQDKGFRIPDNYLTNGAILNAEQTTVVEPTLCNGDKAPVTPTPEPEPEEYVTVKGGTYTYCYEDNWPQLGDYDMNDVVVVTRVDREVSNDGAKVRSMTINWKLKAAGTTCKIAFALRTDQVATSQIADIASSHTAFKNGIFASAGLESGNQQAVIALFNDTKELLSSNNTWKNHPAANVSEQTTKIVFTSPVDAATVTEASLNFFIAVKTRSCEIHMPDYAATEQAIISDGNILPTDPFRLYVTKGKNRKDNHMMWALTIPGDFAYPAEMNDIRDVYTYFMPWATSGGNDKENADWYNKEAKAEKIY